MARTVAVVLKGYPRLSETFIAQEIRGLEEQLHSTLFHRHARGLLLTEQGELLYEATLSMTKRQILADRRGLSAIDAVTIQFGDCLSPKDLSLGVDVETVTRRALGARELDGALGGR